MLRKVSAYPKRKNEDHSFFCSINHDKSHTSNVNLVNTYHVFRLTVTTGRPRLPNPFQQVGIGADEFMAGYSRHRNAFTRGGESVLHG